MLTVPEAFDKFRQKLEITKNEEGDASRRHNDVRECLRDNLGIERDFLSGSYARDTKIRPLKDVDIFCVLDEDEEKQWRTRPARDLLHRVRDVLAKRYDAVQVQRRSVLVEFPRGEFQGEEYVLSMDIVPAFAKGRNYEIPDSDGPVEWVGTNPEVHKGLATDANEAFSKQWKPFVKMVKKWNATKNRPIQPSFLVEVMALEMLNPPWSGSYPREVKSFFATMDTRLAETWKDPAGLGPPVSDRMGPTEIATARGVLRETRRSVDTAVRLEQEGNVGAALRTWREDVFGQMFPLS